MARHLVSPRILGSGAVARSVVHVSTALHSAAREQEIDVDGRNKRSMDLSGYKRVNERVKREGAD